jgi:hypothetical protein
MLIYQIYEIDYSIQNLSKIFDISDVTISKTFKKIVPYRKYIINDDVSEKLFINIQEKNHTDCEKIKQTELAEKALDKEISDIIMKIDKSIFEYKLLNDNFKHLIHLPI